VFAFTQVVAEEFEDTKYRLSKFTAMVFGGGLIAYLTTFDAD
jgi:hypothetical protein